MLLRVEAVQLVVARSRHRIERQVLDAALDRVPVGGADRAVGERLARLQAVREVVVRLDVGQLVAVRHELVAVLHALRRGLAAVSGSPLVDSSVVAPVASSPVVLVLASIDVLSSPTELVEPSGPGPLLSAGEPLDSSSAPVESTAALVSVGSSSAAHATEIAVAMKSSFVRIETV